MCNIIGTQAPCIIWPSATCGSIKQHNNAGTGVKWGQKQERRNNIASIHHCHALNCIYYDVKFAFTSFSSGFSASKDDSDSLAASFKILIKRSRGKKTHIERKFKAEWDLKYQLKQQWYIDGQCHMFNPKYNFFPHYHYFHTCKYQASCIRNFNVAIKRWGSLFTW